MIAPSGGPEDRISPELLSILPEPGTVMTDISVISFIWSERLDPQSISIFIYPPSEFEIEVHASEILVLFEEDTPEPYFVVHIPPGISDMHGNATENSYDLIFSSLDVLPEGTLTVSAEKPGGSIPAPGTYLELYSIENGIDTELTRRTTLDSTGHSEIQWISPGLYRVLCYEDLDNSFLWESDVEAGADTLLLFDTADSFEIEMYLSVVDTIGPILTEIEPLDSYHSKVSFNEDIFTDGLLENITFLDSAGTEISILGYWESGNRTGTSLILESAVLHPERYRLIVSGIYDLCGNIITDDTLEFTSIDSLPLDSLRIRSHFPEPGGTYIDPAGPYYISFNYRINPDSLLDRFSLHCVSDGSLISGDLVAMDGRSFKFTPDHQLLGEQQYVFELLPGLCTTWGDSLSETFSWAFSTKWGDEPGSLSGSITWGGAETLVLQLTRTGGDSDNDTRTAVLFSGNFSMSNIPPGRYSASAFVDANDNEIWDITEPYGMYPGVLLVQPGLMTSGVNIEILP